MASSLNSSVPAPWGISAKMARALADNWRVRILAELSVRPMSPSRFASEVGGELTHIARCCRQLADWGYIEVIEERAGRRRGAAIEHVYRGIHRAHFDTESWDAVPLEGRNEVSHAAVSSYFARLSEAVEASERLAASPEGGIPTIVGLSAFRSPRSPVTMLQASRFHQQALDSNSEELGFAFGPAMAKALSNNWRCRILMELTLRPLSPSQFVEEIGGSMTHIARCFRELAELELVEVFQER